MTTKMPAPIQAITLNRATFSGVTFEPTFLNYFYGNNGAGKSTIAQAIKEQSGITWKPDENPDNYTVLVYNRQFITENFESDSIIDGVFTLDKENIQVQKQVADLNAEVTTKRKELAAKEDELEHANRDREALVTRFQEECWVHSKTVRERFPATQEGKKQKRSFAQAALSQKIAKAHDLAKLADLYAVAHDKNATSYPRLSLISAQLPSSELIDQPIISSADTAFAQFVQAMQATDWVRKGYEEFSDQAKDTCPYCQQKLPDTFESDLATCFDDAYLRDLEQFEGFVERYKVAARTLYSTPMSTDITQLLPTLSMGLYDEKVALLRKTLESNVKSLDAKLATPSSRAELDDVADLIEDINELIRVANTAIDQHNQVVANQAEQKKTCQANVWEHLGHLLDEKRKKHTADLGKLDTQIATVTTTIDTLKNEIKTLETTISELRKSTIDTTAVMEEINLFLSESGFEGFHLAEAPQRPNVYQVVRPNGQIAQHLSEGERNFIAFLYFFHRIRGSLDQAADTRGRIVVIDDPVSSMDSNALFLVAALVRDLVAICANNFDYLEGDERGDYIKQIFILTHNAYFFREASYNRIKDYATASYYLIEKHDNQSQVRLCTRPREEAPSQLENYSPVVNSYAAMWHEYREVTSSVALMNVMRRILEHYFLQLSGYDGVDLRTRILKENRDKFVTMKEDGTEDLSSYHQASAILAYVSHNLTGISDDINFITDAQNPDQLRSAFRQIFELMGQGQHFQMMTGK